MFRHILIPIDGSELAHRAVPHGLGLAKSVGAKVTALIVETPYNVFDLPSSKMNELPAVFAEHAAHVKAHATKVLNGIAEAAKAAGVPCETVQVLHDRPYEAIIATAKERGCDLVVMASHGRGGVSAVVLGSVTNKVLTHTGIPVLVCH